MMNDIVIEMLLLILAVGAIFLLTKIGEKNIRKDIAVSTILVEIVQIYKENKDITLAVDELIDLCIKRVGLNPKISKKELDEIITEVKKHVEYIIQKEN